MIAEQLIEQSTAMGPDWSNIMMYWGSAILDQTRTSCALEALPLVILQFYLLNAAKALYW
jgi:hypothetical protein